MAEQPNKDSDSKGAELKNTSDFKALSLSEMEKELRSKDYSNANEEEQPELDSEASDKDSDITEQDEVDSQEPEKSLEEDTEDVSSETDDSEEESSERSDNQKDKKSKKDKKPPFDFEKAYKELQPEFTRRSQQLKEMTERLAALESKLESTPAIKDEQTPKEKDKSRLSQLKEKDPEAASALEELIEQEVTKRVDGKLKPVEEKVTLRTRQENTDKFATAITEFQNSELKELEPELLAIYNENPSYWQKVIWDSATAFDILKKELITRHFDKASELRANHLKKSKSQSAKTDRLKSSQVGGKTKVTVPNRDVMSNEEFKKLSLSEMEKRLKKV